MSVSRRVEALVGVAGKMVHYKRFSSQSDVDTLIKSNNYLTYLVKAFITSYAPRQVVGQAQEGERFVYLATRSLTFVPTEKDQIVDGAHVYAIAAINNLAAKGEESLYVLTVRGV